jgi:hypothetical protein
MKDFERLEQEYRKIKAPPYLATRIRAEVAGRAVRPRMLMPAAVTLAVVMLVIVPLLFNERPLHEPAQTMPSLAMVSQMTPDKPGASIISLANVRSMAKPAMPQKPAWVKPTGPRGRSLMNHIYSKENYHA